MKTEGSGGVEGHAKFKAKGKPVNRPSASNGTSKTKRPVTRV